ncbi:hypothetical protein S40288_11269 [Stachybotrys chartarum IBT 40288]|nr:hypothetical protein S40288_11269 [Stachybotrys chartarum IBT 40288]
MARCPPPPPPPAVPLPFPTRILGKNAWSGKANKLVTLLAVPLAWWPLHHVTHTRARTDRQTDCSHCTHHKSLAAAAAPYLGTSPWETDPQVPPPSSSLPYRSVPAFPILTLPDLTSPHLKVPSCHACFFGPPTVCPCRTKSPAPSSPMGAAALVTCQGQSDRLHVVGITGALAGPFLLPG